MRLLAEPAESWRLRAACRHMGPQIFFNERGSTDYSAAREVCASCPVRTDCLDFALRSEPLSGCHRLGMWGGLLPHERERLAARLGRLRMCEECGAPFATTSRALVCSGECRRVRNNRLDRERVDRSRQRMEISA